MMRAPAVVARCITSPWRVSMDSGMSSAFSPAMGGRTRASSWLRVTGAAPGRVDSPPISMIDAPVSAIAQPAAMARAGPLCLPPSEKLSGVTLRIPIMCGRSMASPANAGRGAVSLSSAAAALSLSAAVASSSSGVVRLML